jgi:hypothetical protein
MLQRTVVAPVAVPRLAPPGPPDDPPARLADRLDDLRRRYFVGRESELESFRAALAGEGRPCALLYVYGPGGVGKSVLLREFARAARHGGETAVVALDGREVVPTPAGFLGALRSVLGQPSRRPGAPDGIEDLDWPRRPVLLIDTYEALAPLDPWLRDVLLPRLPQGALVVLAGRVAPPAAWRADPAWSELGRYLPLRNLPPRESRAYLRARGVPPAQHAAVLDFTHGHPLALSLVADLLRSEDGSGPSPAWRVGASGGSASGEVFRPLDAPGVVRTLLERFAERVPGDLHRRALGVCAHARVTTEPLLAGVLGAEDAPGAFEWLRGLSFVEQGPAGLSPHDLAREVLDADLRWRDPDAYRALHGALARHLVRRLRGSQEPARQEAYLDLLFLVRHRDSNRPYYDWAAFGHASAEVAPAESVPALVGMVRRHEGEQSARIARYWLERRPQDFVVFRDSAQQIVGFTAALLLESVTAQDAAADPALDAAWRFVQAHGPLRTGERLLHHRFFVGRDGYQDPATHNMVAMVATMRWLTTPRLAWCFAAVAEPERWRPLFEPIRFPRAPEADFSVGERRYGVFVHDWRVDPPQTWIECKLALDLPGGAAAAVPPGGASAPLVLLSQAEFETAVRAALRDFHRPQLEANPLLRSRLVLATGEDAGGALPVDTLRALLREAAQSLRGSPREEKLYQALLLTYLEPEGTQEQVAERLGLPFNTYRYRLGTGIKRLSAALWERELQAETP